MSAENKSALLQALRTIEALEDKLARGGGATPEPIANVVSTTKVKLMPMVRAVSPSCATARIASPSLVLLISRWTATIMARPAASSIRLSSRNVKWPKV